MKIKKETLVTVLLVGIVLGIGTNLGGWIAVKILDMLNLLAVG